MTKRVEEPTFFEKEIMSNPNALLVPFANMIVVVLLRHVHKESGRMIK